MVIGRMYDAGLAGMIVTAEEIVAGLRDHIRGRTGILYQEISVPGR